jgi:uncharacterized protein YqgV (UPF0045/DUF77 family)
MKKPTASIALQIIPKAKDDKNMIAIIDEVIALISRSGVRYEVGPMETTMEGDLDTLCDIVRKAQDIAIKKGASSVFSNIKILYNPDGVMTIEEKVTKHR